MDISDGIVCAILVDGLHRWTWQGWGSKPVTDVIGEHKTPHSVWRTGLAAGCSLKDHLDHVLVFPQ